VFPDGVRVGAGLIKELGAANFWSDVYMLILVLIECRTGTSLLFRKLLVPGGKFISFCYLHHIDSFLIAVLLYKSCLLLLPSFTIVGHCVIAVAVRCVCHGWLSLPYFWGFNEMH